MNQFFSGNECEELTHSQQQPQAPNAHKKKPTIRLTTRVTMLWAPKGPFFTDSWSQLRSSARHTLSNQQAQLRQLRLLFSQKMDEDTLSRLLALF